MHQGDNYEEVEQEDPPKKKYYFMGDKFENAQFQKDIHAGLINPEIAYESYMKYADMGLTFAGGMFPASRIFSLGSRNLIPGGKFANHIFSARAGKLLDTPANRALITKISNGRSLGVDSYGKSWYAKTLSSGQQIYSYTQNGIIKGAGVNNTPINLITRYGLK